MAILLLLAFATLFAILFRVFMLLSINFDCRSRNLKATTLLTILTFFFPIILGIIYAIIRHDAEPNTKVCMTCKTPIDGSGRICPKCQGTMFSTPLPENTTKLKKRGIAFFVIAVVCFVIGSVCTVGFQYNAVKAGVDFLERNTDKNALVDWIGDVIEDENADTTEDATSPDDSEETTDIGDILNNLKFYDRNGKAYKDAKDVPFYDRDGNIYNFITNEDLTTCFVAKADGKKYESDKCFVDKDGYFVYDEKGEITQADDIITYKDKDGNTYRPAAIATWNKNGEMIFGIN
ncbi:MAG: hypothetical protein IJS03_01660 [Eubacterium sp.]|nr:hypothetical protein [Eubacterium sp.]